MNFKHLFCIILIVSSCRQKSAQVTIKRFLNFQVIDTTSTPETFLTSYNDITDYPIYYLGAINDTIGISNRYCNEQIHGTSYKDSEWSKNYSTETLEIFVDTTFVTNLTVQSPSGISSNAVVSPKKFSSYLMSIQNISDSSIFLGRTVSLYYLNLQAKDRNGNWISVDRKLSDLDICLTDEPQIVLHPDEIVISKVKRYKGKYTTDFRMAFGYGNNVVYSNVFKDSIDEIAFSIK